jgi:molybdopterin-binding protein
MVQDSGSADGESSVTMAGTVEKIIKPLDPSLPEKAHIGIECGDLHREIRVDSVVTNAQGQEFELKKGAEVEVTIHAEAGATTKI